MPIGILIGPKIKKAVCMLQSVHLIVINSIFVMTPVNYHCVLHFYGSVCSQSLQSKQTGENRSRNRN